MLASLNTLSIGIGVLGLAGLCFLVSVAWTRIDRSTAGLPESSASGGPRAGGSKTERTTLDQLIGNRVPMIEEQAHLPDRMDYFGPELGRKRMIIDPPHGVAGPHFAVAPAGARTGRSSREPVLAAAASPQQQGDNATSHTEARLTRAALQIRQLRRRRQQAAAIEPQEVTSNETAGNKTSGSSERTRQVARISNPCESPESTTASTVTSRPQHPGCSTAAGVLERGLLDRDWESIADHVPSGRTARKSVLSVPPFQMGRTTGRNATPPLETQRNETQPTQTDSALAEPRSDEPDASLQRVGLLERVLIAMERERRS
jgi:hypothetical protein